MAKSTEKNKKPRRALHIGVLILGIYILFLGIGTLIGEVGALVILGEREAIVFIRIVMGLVFTGLGIYAVWDSIRDLWPKKEEAPPLQFILTDTAGVSSSNVTPERLHEQLSLVSEEVRPVTLQLVTPIPVAELGELINMAYVHMEDGWSLIAVCRQDGGVQVRRKTSGVDEAETVMTALLEGKVPDLSGWERLEAVPYQEEQRAFQLKRRLVLTRDNGTSNHEFFTERDLDLAVTGLEDGTYQEVTVQIGSASVNAVPLADGNMMLHLQFQTQDGPRAFWRIGMPNQARFWLVQFCDGSLFQLSSEGWETAKPE
ncbi:MAG: hypothetical protein HDT20_08200 [Oscillibacter sp.]|nr:hypothetical protein [Oscillibacter sp.]